GFAAGFVAVNAALLPCKLKGIDLLWIYYVLIALAGFLLGGGVAFVILKTNDKKIAKRLDCEFDLKESVQTALEYQDAEGDMLAVQRERVSDALAKIPTKRLAFKHIIATALCGVICLLGIVAIPVTCTYASAGSTETPAPPPPDEPIRTVTDWEWAALDELITYVTNSKKADSVTKTGMLLQLNGLKGALLDGVTESSLAAFVQNTVNGVRNVVKDANARSGVSEGQKTLNSQEGEYVVNRLFEIFSLSPDSQGGEDDNKPDDNNQGSSGGNLGTGELNISDIPFFDPEKGFVKMGEVRDEYYERVQQAFDEGALSREEWEYIVLTYFADLTNKDNQ
ncbi:MAG: hypothetical protein NC037_03925, partial [Bacteroides sp.]|nr:hypothetical protein [Bacteroides sp.]